MKSDRGVGPCTSRSFILEWRRHCRHRRRRRRRRRFFWKYIAMSLQFQLLLGRSLKKLPKHSIEESYKPTAQCKNNLKQFKGRGFQTDLFDSQ